MAQLLCKICFRLIDFTKTDAVLCKGRGEMHERTQLDDPACFLPVHHGCILLRQAAPRERLDALARCVTDDAQVTGDDADDEPDDTPAGDTDDEIYEKETDSSTGGGREVAVSLCSVCEEVVEEGETRLTTRCVHRAMHWMCAENVGARRRLGCPLCLGTDEDEEWARWTGDLAAPHAREEVGRLGMRDAGLSRGSAGIETLPIQHRFDMGYAAEAIAGASADSTAPSAIQLLARSLWQEDDTPLTTGVRSGRRSVLEYLQTREYVGKDVLTLGGKFEFFTVHERDFALMLTPTFMPVPVLASRSMGGSFIKIMRAGFDAGAFTRIPYTVDDLRGLRFSVPAFIAAGGTRAEIARMAPTREVLASDFGLTFGIDQAFV